MGRETGRGPWDSSQAAAREGQEGSDKRGRTWPIQTGLWALLPLTLVWVQRFQMPNVSDSMNEEGREGAMGSAMVLALFS